MSWVHFDDGLEVGGDGVSPVDDNYWAGPRQIGSSK